MGLGDILFIYALSQIGKSLAEIYRRNDLAMHPVHFENPEGGQAVEPGLMEMLQRFQTQRLLVFNHLGEWFEEFRMYHRKQNKVVPFRDDLMSATRYAFQSQRFAVAGEDPSWTADVTYRNYGIV